MDQIDVPSQQEGGSLAGPPCLFDWVWRPWYAKLWWGAIAAFWFAAFLVPPGWAKSFPLGEDVIIYAAMILHPQVALPVLGLGYVRHLIALNRRPGNDSNGASGDEQFLDGMRKRMNDSSDPANPASPMNPANPGNWRHGRPDGCRD